jgi:hypothetical protein
MHIKIFIMKPDTIILCDKCKKEEIFVKNTNTSAIVMCFHKYLEILNKDKK